MKRTTFSVPKMDCGAEEQLVRMALSGRPEIHRIEANLGARELIVIHEGDADQITAVLAPLNLGTELIVTTVGSELDEKAEPAAADEARTLKVVLARISHKFSEESRVS